MDRFHHFPQGERLELSEDSQKLQKAPKSSQKAPRSFERLPGALRRLQEALKGSQELSQGQLWSTMDKLEQGMTPDMGEGLQWIHRAAHGGRRESVWEGEQDPGLQCSDRRH